jgi:uncharacterized secreted protein with C-terminal beta-propeller domain
MATNSMFRMAGIGIAAAIGFVFALTWLGNTFPRPPVMDDPRVFDDDGNNNNQTNATRPTGLLTATQALKQFSSVYELKSFLASLEQNRSQLSSALQEPFATFGSEINLTLSDGASGGSAESASAPSSQGTAPDSAAGGSSDYSTTNVQVQRVDDPDFVKNDSKYAYILSGDRLAIVDAYPAENANVAVKIALDIHQGQYLQNIFLNNDTLVIFYQEFGEEYVIQEYDFATQPVYSPKTHVLVMDVSDRENPRIVHDYEITGGYNNARMIGERVYLVTTSDLYNYRHPIIPKVVESSRTIVAPEIYYFDNPEPYYSFNTVTSIDIASADAEDAVDSQTYMMNPAATLYISEDNIYIAYQKNMPYYYYQETYSKDRFFEAVVPLLPSNVQQEIKDIEATDDLGPSEKWDSVSELL